MPQVHGAQMTAAISALTNKDRSSVFLFFKDIKFFHKVNRLCFRGLCTVICPWEVLTRVNDSIIRDTHCPWFAPEIPCKCWIALHNESGENSTWATLNFSLLVPPSVFYLRSSGSLPIATALLAFPWPFYLFPLNDFILSPWECSVKPGT